MKWNNHKLCTFGTVLMLTGNIAGAFISMCTSCLPDRLEGRPPDQKSDSNAYWQWRKRHRGYSHWLALYVVLLVVYIYGCRFANMNKVYSVAYAYGVFLFLGCILHIFEDAVCGKVAWLLPGQKHGIRLFKVGSWQEYFFVFAWLIFLYLVIGQKMMTGTADKIISDIRLVQEYIVNTDFTMIKAASWRV